MITPRFNLSQDESTLTINVRAPYCNLNELDTSVENNEFLFVCAPYYLRLNLPGNILENGSKSKTSFDADSGEFSLTYEKQNAGENFANLEFITAFLQPKIEVESGGRKIEILTGEDPSDCKIESSDAQYGFALRGGYNFQIVNSEFSEIFKLDPFEVKFEDRCKIRFEDENRKFDVEHYKADFMDDVEITGISELQSPWVGQSDTSFSQKELDFLKDLPNINFNLTTQQINYAYNSLIEILYAYCYDFRTSYFEGTCESAWNISTLSSSLSYFDSFSTLKEAIISAYRRSLMYPLYRSFKLCNKIFEDLKLLLTMDKVYIIKCLIKIHEIFLEGSFGRYILNKLFIDDYIVYMMKCDVNLWKETVDKVCTLEIDQSDLGLNLSDIENQINNEDLSVVFRNLELADDTDSDDTCSCSCTSDSGSSSDSESDDNESRNI